MHDSVDFRPRDDLRDHGVTDVGSNELTVAEVMGRRDHVDPDHATHRRIVAEHRAKRAPR